VTNPVLEAARQSGHDAAITAIAARKELAAARTLYESALERAHAAAVAAVRVGVSQVTAARLTGLSRMTVRKALVDAGLLAIPTGTADYSSIGGEVPNPTP